MSETVDDDGEEPWQLEPVTANNLKTLKVLVRTIFPVTYSDKFYDECMNNEFCRVILRRGEAIGFVAVKPEFCDFKEALYIRSLGVHPCYRNLGIGCYMMQFVEKKCRALNLPFAFLHVQTVNETAVQFYKERGFKKEHKVRKYYQRVDSPDAYLMTKTFL